ncbi:MAG: hypothetical protein ACJ72D_03780 [Marmoricola sp.]
MSARLRRRSSALLAALLLVLVAGPSLSAAEGRARTAGASDLAYHQTKTLTRTYAGAANEDGSPGADIEVNTKDVTVTADKTTDLQARERVGIRWSGAQPSGGRAANPYGENGLQQEYPVVIMQCRGVDDPSLPKAEQLRPDTCWTSTYNQRTVVQDASSSVWLHDRYAAADDLEQVQLGGAKASDCHVPDGFAAHVTPFVTAEGKVFSGCSQTTMPPEAAVGATDPPAELEAFTGADGSGSAQFEVRTDTENASLGCSHTVACSIVVVPIMGVSCSDADRDCRRTGQFRPGSSNFAQLGVDDAVSPRYWWSGSNWRNRFSIPISFGLPPSTCQLLATGAPVPFYGSELLSQAALQWAPSYCLDKRRFNWQANTMADDAAFSLMTSGESAAAEVSGERDAGGAPVGYAPTAVTGFGISYVIDKPDNAGALGTLKLDARLLAKLLTESYPGSTLGKDHPGLGRNPVSMNLDPEFQKLNPGLDKVRFSEAASTLLTLSTSADVIRTMTGYIANDPQAMDFLHGKPDPWGMTVNPSYKNIVLPVSTWPLLDTWVPSTPGQLCLAKNPAPYLPKIAAPVSSLRLIATAVLLAWPNVQTRCDTDPTSGLFKLGRIDPQGVGARFMLGVVTLGDAARYGLDVASLQAAPGAYVAPDDAGLTGALALARQSSRSGAFTISQAAVRKSARAYPGTMVVYTAAKTSGLPKAQAADVAQFIRVSSSEGQRAGRGNGQLPDGYLPIRNAGATKPLYATAQRVASLIAAQKPVGSGGAGATDGSAVPPAGQAPATASGAPQAQVPISDVGLAPAAVKTLPVRSGLGGALLPLLLLLGIAGGIVAAFGRVALRIRVTR